MNDQGSKMKEVYKQQFKEHGISPKSLGCLKGRQEIRFDALTSNLISQNKTLLDYGCGFGDLSKYLINKNVNIKYTGIDIVPEFINVARQKQKGEFILLKTINEKIDLKFDYIICSGVFNFLYDEDEKKHKELVFNRIFSLFNSSKRILSIDFQSPYVDFKGSNSFHQDISSLIKFVSSKLSKKFYLNHSYMPYEFCIHIYKDSRIKRPDNVF